MGEARIRMRAREGSPYSWDKPRVIEVEDYPKFIYIREPSGLLKAYKRREFESDGYYRPSKHHEKYDMETGASYAEYEEVDKDILIIESE